MINKLSKKIAKKFRNLFYKTQSSFELDEKKRMEDYNYLISHGVETEYGFVELGGKPIITKYPNSRIIIGKNVTLLSDSLYNEAGINHPVILATCAENSKIEIKDGCGMSGTSIVCVKNIQIGYNTMLGVNTNIYDTDFHPLDSIKRRNQKNITDATSAPIVIGDDVWIGANCTILKGVVIDNCSVIGIHSLVNKNVGENELHAGVPARFIKKIN